MWGPMTPASATQTNVNHVPADGIAVIAVRVRAVAWHFNDSLLLRSSEQRAKIAEKFNKIEYENNLLLKKMARIFQVQYPVRLF